MFSGSDPNDRVILDNTMKTLQQWADLKDSESNSGMLPLAVKSVVVLARWSCLHANLDSRYYMMQNQLGHALHLLNDNDIVATRDKVPYIAALIIIWNTNKVPAHFRIFTVYDERFCKVWSGIIGFSLWIIDIYKLIH